MLIDLRLDIEHGKRTRNTRKLVSINFHVIVIQGLQGNRDFDMKLVAQLTDSKPEAATAPYRL